MKNALSTFAFLLFAVAFLSCGVDERRAIPTAAQETIERVTEDIAAGRDQKVYAEAAEEWRARVSEEENRRILAQARERLGRVNSRAMHSGRQQQSALEGAHAPAAQTLVVTYQTTFERGTAMETFTLLERDGNWRLAGYSISSDALRQ
ncbi:MAG TPA: DUF4019 domain-containing protein [Pyrinomonadaceae bacterium]|nr:DUF4019 domain-containing protein [Pyrinomonadaceae bacterium]